MTSEPSIPRSPAVLRALRPHQWIKNLLVFAPVLLSHRWTESALVFRTAIVAVAFCLLCSGIYVINDLLDVESDRRHPLKKQRPFASRQLEPRTGLLLAVASLAVCGVLLLWIGSPGVAWVLSLYAAAALIYSGGVKRLIMVDVGVLAGLYCIRIYAGAIATDIPVSPWTFAFSLFGFMSIALMKRYSELFRARETGQDHLPGRAYIGADLPLIGAIGVGSGMLAVLVVALYVTAPETSHLYSRAYLLSLLCPIVLVTISRLWVIAGRGQMNEDPVLFAIRDRFSILALCLVAGIILLAR